MDISEKRCVLLQANDLQEPNLGKTAKIISANLDKFYLLSVGTDMELCDVIGALSKSADVQEMLTRTRFAYDMAFPQQTTMYPIDGEGAESENKTKVATLSELLEQLAYDENQSLARPYRIIVDDTDAEDEYADAESNENAKKTVARLFQQMMFLNLNVDIQRKSEIKKGAIKERFRERYQTLRQNMDDLAGMLDDACSNAQLSEEGYPRVKLMQDALQGMKEKITEAQKRPIRIAVMGTKKAGKSVVINSLLKTDFAPTSSEMPTPNCITYVPDGIENVFTLEYKNQKFTFASGESLREYIGKEFEAAQKHTGEGSGLEDMVIHYYSPELTGYEILDTPGPNFAGAMGEHQRIAEECIEKADICIFVMNYSNHLTTDEVNFLEKIRGAFALHNKFYSLFIAINRIDERYAADVEKSVIRIVDYIRKRLGELEYKDIVLFGTSALQSFYLEKMRQLIKNEGKEQEKTDREVGLIDKSIIRDLKKNHKESITPLRFIENALMNLEDFHDIDEPTEKEVEAFSGIPQLSRYVRYIGEQKTDMEIVDHVVSMCETQFAAIRNALLITDLMNLSEQEKERLDELAELVKQLRSTVRETMKEIDPLLVPANKDSALYHLAKQVKSAQNKAEETGMGKIDAALDQVSWSKSMVASLADRSEEDVPASVRELGEDIDNIVQGINNEMTEQLDDVKDNLCADYITKVENAMQNIQTRILAAKKSVEEKIDQSSEAARVLSEFKMPEFPASLNRLEASAGTINDLGKNSLARIAGLVRETRSYQVEHTKTVPRDPEGVIEHILWLIPGVKFTKEVKYNTTETETEYNVEKFKTELHDNLITSMKNKIAQANEIMSKELEEKVSAYYGDIGKQCDSIRDEYKQQFDRLQKDIQTAQTKTGEHKDALDKDIKMFNSLKEQMQPFFNVWEEILHGKSAAKEE